MVRHEDLKRFLDGHRAADARLREGPLRGLASLGVEESESRAEYDSLCRDWETFRKLGDQAALDRRAIEAGLAVRRRVAAKR